MSTGIHRRDFLGRGAAGIAMTAVGLNGRRSFAQSDDGKRTIGYRELGSTGFRVSEIGFGAMNMRDPELVRAAIDSGINYIDTANRYMNGVNEEIVGQVMATERDKVFLTTKFPWENPDEMPAMMETSLKRLQTDHVDLALLHIVSNRESAMREDVMKVMDGFRSKDQARFVGVSTHENQAEVLDAAVEGGFWDAVLTGYSYLSSPDVTAAISRARKAGIAIIAMKTLITVDRPRSPLPDVRDGRTDITNEQALLRWVLNNPDVDTIIPGMTSFEHLEQDLAVMGMSMSFGEGPQLRRFAENRKVVACLGVAGCTGCRDKCPKGVALNELNRCINYAEGYGSIELARENYRVLPASNRIEQCGDCDECQVTCVNGINLTGRISRARELFA